MTKNRRENYANPNYRDEVTIKGDLSFYKSGSDAILDTDEFGIFSAPKIRKKANPNRKDAGLKDIRVISGELNDQLITSGIKDYKTKKINIERTIDAIPMTTLRPGNTMNSQSIQQVWKPLFNLK